ncbi:UDP-glucose 4-epimerase [compost metagenome]
MPFVAQVAAGLRPEVKVFGSDYATSDGTGVRDYIHVMDLASAHVNALRHLAGSTQTVTLNLGTGRGYSVLEIIQAFGRACGHPVPYRLDARRPGDADACYADPARAEALLHWRAERDLEQICADAWRWQQHLSA